MAILPEGFALPPPTYLAALLAAAAVVARAALRRRPTVTTGRVLALAPWMALGSALHVLYVVEALPALARPLAGTPAVYVTVAVAAVGAWVALDAVLDERDGDSAGQSPRVARALALGGGALALVAVVRVLAVGVAAGALSPLVPAASVVVAAVLAAAVWFALTRVAPETRTTGALGAFAVFAHVLDGVSTAAGIDLLGFGERTPLSRLIVEFAAGLPTEPVLGSGWLFVLVKIAVASLVVWLFADLVETDPTEARLLLGFVAAVGFGPATHNVLLFAISAPG
ncbi:DUF63 family protein [Halobellus limi]|uniref:DUF63 family protein n=1 Tax=Halobellus limi TaxID=699433 RepID=A0A1H5UFX0_9EURY|nr:DUF63 family protein [Halobellus limi]QCC47047.1 DUF63 family protein [Halobellus limi]SEF73916.1 Uncharacterized membrane protein [Halobellus limi]